MEIGFLHVMQNWHQNMSDYDMYRGEIELALSADRLGYDSIWCVEHHFEDYGLCPENIQYLSYLASQTKNARLVPGAVIVPWNDPLRVAEKMAMLEYFAPGRIALGLGRGLARREYDGFGIPMTEARGRFDEGARMILDALDTGFCEGAGPLYKQPRVEIRPRPLRGYRNDLYCVAMSPDSADAAAQLGGRMMTFIQHAFEKHIPMIEHYRECWRKHQPGREPLSPVLTDVTILHEDAEEAHRLAYQHIGQHFVAVTSHYEFAGEHFKGIRGYESYQKGADMMRAAGLDQSQKVYVEAQNYGTPKQVVEKYRERMDMIGEFNAMCVFSMGGLPFDKAQNSMKLFAEQVAPELRKMQPKRRAVA